jgi:hypothetical protein
MWAYFSRDDVALPGLASWFAACSLEERDHGAFLRLIQTHSPYTEASLCAQRRA